MKIYLGAAFLAAGVSLAAGSVALAQAPFYEGKQLRIVVGFAPGGGNDLFARVFPEGFSRAIEGNPEVIVENMPGAGGVTGLNWFVNVAPRDGTVAYVTSGNLINRMVLGFDGVQAEVSDMIPLIAGPLGRVHYITTGTGYSGPEDLLDLEEELYLGVTDPLSTASSVVGLKVLGVPYRAVQGYPGKNDALLALQRGENTVGDMVAPLYVDGVEPLVEEGTVLPLFSQGFMEGDEFVRDSVVPDIPTLQEFYQQVHGQEPSGPGWEAYKTIARSVGNGGKVLMIHKDTPPEAIEALHEAFSELLQDESFLANAEAALEGYGFLYGENLDTTMASIIAMPEDSKQWLRDLYTNEYDMTFSD